MSISGDLLDVSVAEVMQFIHLGRRTGTLKVQSGDQKAEIGFHRGRIISAWKPDSKRLGERLVHEEMLDPQTLETLLEEQERHHPRPSLGKLLVDRGALAEDDLYRLVRQQIEDTVYQLVTWRQGSFEFALDELRPIDDLGFYPGDLLPDINLDTQMVVLDALRIFDEKNRSNLAEGSGTAEPSATGSQVEAAEASRPNELSELLDDESAESPDAQSGEVARAPARLHLVTPDEGLHRDLAARLRSEGTEIGVVDPMDAGLTLPGESPPVVLVDLRREPDLERLETVCRSRPRASVLALVDPSTAPAAAYEAGALAVLPPDPGAITACLRSLTRARRWLEQEPAAADVRSGFARLRRVVADLRSGLLSATVALNLMQVISESVERAILFLVQEDRLLALGAFGAGEDGQPLAQVTSGYSIPLAEGGALTDALDHWQTRSMDFEAARLPERLAAVVGRPRTGQVVIFPVLGSTRVMSVVYADNGSLSREIEEIEIVELAAAQVGVAFENEILRRRMDRLKGQ